MAYLPVDRDESAPGCPRCCAVAELTNLAHAQFVLQLQVIVVGLGDRQNAMLFSKLLDFPLRLLYAGECLHYSLMWIAAFTLLT